MKSCEDMMDTAELDRAILEFIARGVEQPRDEEVFNALALRLFAHQFAHNLPYRRLCQRRGRTPASVSDWRRIPSVPIGAFKELTLACEPPDQAVAVFMTSGTTHKERRGKAYHTTLEIYDASMRVNFAAHVLPDGAGLPLLILFPPPTVLPHSSLSHYLAVALESFGADGSGWFMDEKGLDGAGFREALRTAEGAGRPVGLLGASFAFVHFLDYCAERGLRFRLPPGSRLMDTGGFKGRSREIGRADLYRQFGETFGIPETHTVNMYGMTEFSIQFYDVTLRRHAAGQPPAHFKVGPPWSRTRIIDPETAADKPAGEVGVLLHLDLANRNTVSAILTEDLGRAEGDGFELLGRVQGAEARGCSMAIDEFLSAARR
ncbi:MAG TPA: hypothetical protein VED18_04480 [Candidatus Sulfotelmatobacter sp.]|nr:hypothetical protein [Candidatus Sulfotelmatobacter sp.]